ncbi:MAG TPA: histidinol dehydrogenase [Actinobacteria bacterium]|nr:histidinol dehydrogenase [Actinomycetota bacterium]
MIRLVHLAELTPDERTALTRRSVVPDPRILAEAARIVDDVRRGGHPAVVAANLAHGGGRRDGTTTVSLDERDAAYAEADPDFLAAVEAAVSNIRRVHEAQRPADGTIEPVPGVRVERRWTPLRRVGVYVPGGRAAYPSSLLMGVVPAQVAGVDEIAVVTPADGEGRPNPAVLAAAAFLGIDEIHATGGAQAIGALAHGTEEIPRVDKIVGPGGAWVTAAKLAVHGVVGVDLPAGPSEAAVVVDETADPEIAAADLLCQAEHGPDSAVLLVATDAEIAARVLAETERRLRRLARRDLVAAALEDHGLAVVAPDHDAALAFVEAWAPEHLTLHTRDPHRDAEAVPSAGSVFLGTWTPESAGDYATGANHVLPTGGLARAHGPLSTEDFGSWRQIQELTPDGLRRLAPTIRTLAHTEGLTAHAACVDVRLEAR